MTPVLGGEVVERGQLLPVLVELRDGFGVLRVELAAERLERPFRVGACGRFDDLVQECLGAWLQPLGQRVQCVRGLMDLMKTSA